MVPGVVLANVAWSLGAELGRLGFCVVSGLARGIDTAAHEGALSVEGKTVGVLGTGPDAVYPPENGVLFRRIKGSGALLSEFPFGRPAIRQSFPMRNRVVSGMSAAVVVVESAVDGGAMITARFAGEQGRNVFAVPGRIDQATSAGCHQLIRDGATLLITQSNDSWFQSRAAMEQHLAALERERELIGLLFQGVFGLLDFAVLGLDLGILLGQQLSFFL